MEKERLYYLLQQHLDNKATAAEQQELASVVNTGTQQELFVAVLGELSEQETPALPAETAYWQQMITGIINIDKPILTATPVTTRMVTLYKWIAAAVVLLLAGTLVFYFLPAKKVASPPTLAVAPVNSNVLLLADQTPVLLDSVPNGVIASQPFARINKNDSLIIYTATNGKGADYYNVLSTARSSKYGIVLPDGSQVWLNAASSLRFPTHFSTTERVVALSGEAWFDVQHAEQLPFRIQSGSITTSVMGTAFDIKAYPGEQTVRVAVQRGKVKVAASHQQLALLEKGRQVTITVNGVAREQAVNPEEVAGWRKGHLFYKDETLLAIVADLQRLFNVSITIHRASLQQEQLTVSLDKNAGLKSCLDMICTITDSHLNNNKGVYTIE